MIDAKVVAKADPTGWSRCVRWCGRYGQPPQDVSENACEGCLSEELLEGTIESCGGETYPVVRGVPRVLEDPFLVLVDALSDREWLRRYRRARPAVTRDFDRQQLRIAKAFGQEWQYFSKQLTEYQDIAREYFDLLRPEDFAGMVLDAGCGTGRWARQIAGCGRALMAVDLSASVDVAAPSLGGFANTHVVQADMHRLPFRRDTFDLVYSLGVLHHLPDPEQGLRALLQHVKPGGRFLAYFYYALDNRPKHFHVILPGVTALRLVISRMPHRAARWMCFVIALIVYWPLIQLGNVLQFLGLRRAARQVPLYEFYAGKSFRILFNDSVDRFATSVEFRFSLEQIRAMYNSAGLDQVTFSTRAPFWKALGRRP